jgi:DHA2 family multidrug resistance protein
MIAGFSLLVINTWQLSRIQADTNISWIILLLILRGLALGMTVQTTFVTALSIVPPRDLPRGSSLTNATRFIFQSIGVAVLSTVLASNLSPGVQAMQSNLAAPSTAEGAGFSGLCEPAPLSSTRGGGQPLAASQQACQENIAGFEEAYQITFYAALLALLLGSFLPGWPGKWVGRQAASPP